MQERGKGKEERGKVCWKEGIEGKVRRIGERERKEGNRNICWKEGIEGRLRRIGEREGKKGKRKGLLEGGN